MKTGKCRDSARRDAHQTVVRRPLAWGKMEGNGLEFKKANKTPSSDTNYKRIAIGR